MKNIKLIFGSSFLLLIISSANLFAQSDLEIVNGFKAKQKDIEERIKGADSLSQLNAVAAMIDQLKSEYAPHKELLNRSLYPDNFDKVIQNLNLAFITRNNDFVQIDVLSTELAGLKQQVEFLNQRNNELLAEVEDLKAAQKKDKSSIARLENLVADLKSSLLKRDRLVLSMVDSLLPPLIPDKANLSPEEVKKLKSEEEKNNVIDNVKKAINNHIEFLGATSSKPADLETMSAQKQKFAKTWQSIGARLVEVYSNEKEKADKLKEIETLFGKWDAALKQEAWNSIQEEFERHNINLQKFSNGNEFSDVSVAFITDEIKNAEVKNQAEAQKTYENFADSTWYASIKTEWMPYLLDHKMFTEQQKNEVEEELSQWKAAVYPANLLWLYILIAAVVLAGVIFFIMKSKKKPEIVEQ